VAGGAIGSIEVDGYAPFLQGADAMLKAANVQPLKVDSPGVALMSLYVQGDVGAVRMAVEAGVAAAGASRALPLVLANPGPGLAATLGLSGAPAAAPSPPAWSGPGLAIGAVQVEGAVAAIEATDAMVKAANVVPIKFQWIGLAWHVVCIAGEIGAVRVAVDAGVAAAERVSPVLSCLLANPHPDLVSLLGFSAPPSPVGDGGAVRLRSSLGVLETRGLAASSEGTDAMLKSARVTPVRYLRCGLAWLASMVTGEVGAVTAAVSAGSAAASRVSEVKSCVVASPSPALLIMLGIGGSNG